ncbi:MAG: membrane-bound lytic murein transglycosylase MltF [Chromatiales bacterium]|nr:MAG: membrane-bound lytic murein transglycosylase MltF [Chromatiales bacterium]
MPPSLRFFALTIAALCIFLGTCSEPPPLTEQIQYRGTLRVITRNSPVTYYIGPGGPMGPEYELARDFAEGLGVKLELMVADSIEDIVPAVESGQADIAAAGLAITAGRGQQVAFGPTYDEVSEHLIYKLNTGRPRTLDDVVGARLEVAAGSNHAETLERLRDTHPDLVWIENPVAENEELLVAVSTGEIDYTLADSNEFAVSQLFHPELRIALDLEKDRRLAWAFVKQRDQSLVAAARRYFDRVHESGMMTDLKERYFGHAQDFDYVGTRAFLRDINRKLPQYRYLFEQAAQSSGVNWRLLAAIGYQESHWNPTATSPTGVRGMMMLTEATAGQLGIEDRLDPSQSIVGGARYFVRVKRKIPERIAEPDRTFMALAAYNVGFGHLEDARIITQIRGGNPDEWLEVRGNLPLLAEKKWYSRVKRGYARGWEPVNYVDNIRNYLSILEWKVPDERIKQASRNISTTAPVSSDTG